jgi:MFS family permease
LHVVNGAFISLADALTGPALVLTAFVLRLTASDVVIGLLAPMRDAGWFLPQLFITDRVERASRKARVYRNVAFARVGAWMVLVACVLTVQDPPLLLAAFYACIALSSVLSGLAGLPYLLVTAKVIPPDRRGLLFGLRQSLGGGLGVAAGGVVALLLGGQLGIPFPLNYALVFAFATAMYAVAYGAFSAVREAPDPVAPRATPMRRQLARAWTLTRRDPQFQRFLLMRACNMLGGACIPFLTVYAKRDLSVPDSFIGSLVSVTLASSLLSNAVWARASDRRGNRLVVVAGSALGALVCALAAAASASAPGALPAEPLLIVLFALSGAMSAGLGLASGPLLMEMAPDEHRSLYIGFSNTALGGVLLATSLAGVVADRLGYTALFLVCGAAYGLALGCLAGLREPRRASLPAPALASVPRGQ